MKTEILHALHILESEPNNTDALAQLAAAAEGGGNGKSDPAAARSLGEARRIHRERGDFELVVRLCDLELGWEKDPSHRAELLFERAQVLDSELLREPEAEATFQRVLVEKPGHEGATEALGHIGAVRERWQKIVQKYLSEAGGGADRQLASGLYLSAAETTWKYQPGAAEIEVHLRKALEVDAKNRRAATHLERLLRSAERWSDLAALIEQRSDGAPSRDAKVALLVTLADLQRDQMKRPDLAQETMTRALALDPANPRALAALVDALTALENWQGLLKTYESALKARPRGEAELAIHIQMGTVWWRQLGNGDQAEPFFAKVRKVDPGRPAMLSFYRAYHGERNETAKLLQVLGQAQKVAEDPKRRLALGIEMAEVAEASAGNLEKAIDIWKGILKQSAGNPDAGIALKRLYIRAEKWNALLELLKEQIDALPKDSPEAIAERVSRLLEVVAIYRDRLNLDVMVINTYNTILAIAPGNEAALAALGAKYEQMGRWNDLIGVLQRKADAAPLLPEGNHEKTALLRRIASLWIEKFGNHNQAVKPLEELYALLPGDPEAVAQLRDIYTRRRAWRALVDLERKDLERPAGPKGADRRAKLIEMAKLAAERLGDAHEAIALWNRLFEDNPEDNDALVALAALYEREKRFPALVEVLRRQKARATDAKGAIPLLEKIGTLWVERLGAPHKAIEAYQEILRLAPNQQKAVRVLRELFAQAGDFERLEALYAEHGQWEELCETLLTVAERTPSPAGDNALKIRIYQRVAEIAQRQLQQPDRAAKAFERILAVDPQHLGAANALIPIYRGTEKWARLLATYEILLGHALEEDQRLALHAEIRMLCEEKLGSKQLAFSWCARAYELRPDDAALAAELSRLAREADAYEELVVIYAVQVEKVAEGADKVARYRQLADLIFHKLHRADEARPYYIEVLKRLSDDAESGAALEQIYTQAASFPDLLALYRGRVERIGSDPATSAQRIDLWFKIAQIEEEKSGELDSAAESYQRILGEEPSSAKALRALERIFGARGNAGGLAEVLAKQLDLLRDDVAAEVAICYQLGELHEMHLAQPERALDYYQRAFARQPAHRPTVAALERFLAAGSPGRIDVARLLAPVYERADEAAPLAGALAILLEAAAGDRDEELGLLRRLALLVGRRLGEAERAYTYCSRIFTLVPADPDNRRELTDLADLLERHEDLSRLLTSAEAAAMKAEQPELARDLAWELATLLDERLHQPAIAEQAWRRVLERDPRHDGAFRALERHHRADENYKELRLLLVQRKELALEMTERRELLFQICDLDEGVFEDAEAAARTYSEALEVDPASQRAFKALERIYSRAEKWLDQDELYERAVPYAGKAEERAQLKLKRADLHAQRLDDPPGACDLYEEALGEDGKNDGARKGVEKLMNRPELRLRAARIMEPLFAADEAWAKLVQVLTAQREKVEGREAVELLARIARLVEDKQGSRQQAFGSWREALRLDPTDEAVRTEVERLGCALERFAELAQAWEEAEARCEPHDLLLRADLLRKAALLYDAQIGDAARARAAWRRLLDLDPTRLETARPAAEALARLYEAEEAWPDLIEVLRRQAEWADPGEPRKEFQRRVGLIQEDLASDLAAAVATHREILDADPEDRPALDALERLHSARSEWSDLCEILRRRVELSRDSAARRDLLWRIAELTEQRLHPGQVNSDVLAGYTAILDEQPEDVPTLDALARLYQAADRSSDLQEVLERRLALARTGSERVGLLGRLAWLLESKLSHADQALDRFREMLAVEPDNTAARAGLERMLRDDELRLRAAEVLEPIYEAKGGDLEMLCQLSELFAEHSPDPHERIARLRKVARLREQGGNPKAALDALSRASRIAVAESELGQLLDGIEHLAGQTGMRAEQVTLYRELGADILDSKVQERVYLAIASEARTLGDRATARDYFRRVLDGAPEHPKALDALESLYHEGRELEPLLEIYNRRADLAQGDDERRRHYLALAAGVCAKDLDRPSEAIACHEQILELFPSDPEAAQRLEELYQQGARFADLADLLERRVGFADDLDEAVALRFRLGQLYEKELSDSDRAVDNYRAAMGGDADHVGVIGALERFLDDANHRVDAAEVLEPVYASRHDWKALIRIYEIRLEAADDPAKRLGLTRRIARLYEEQLEDLEAAFRWFGKVFREAPADRGMRDQLARLANVLGRHAELAVVYEEYLAETYEETPASIEVLRTLAALYDGRLGAIDKAKVCYKRLLAADPNDGQAFQLLEASLLRASRWQDLLTVYRDATEGGIDNAARKVLLFKICDLQQAKLKDPAAAIDAYRAVLDVDGEDVRAITALDHLYVEAKRWHDLADLLQRRLEKADAAQRSALKLRLAALHEFELDDLPSAIDAYEEVVKRDPRHKDAIAALERLIMDRDQRFRIAQILEPIYRVHDQWAQLVVIYGAELEFIDDKTRRVALLREIARIHAERGGDLKLAFSALARAWREEAPDGSCEQEADLYQNLCDLAVDLKCWDDLVAVLEQAVAGSYDYDLVARVHARVADIHDRRLGDAAAAVESWRRVVGVREDDVGAWKAIERLLGSLGRHAELVEVLERRGELSHDLMEQKALAYRTADLHEHTLRQPDRAVATWRHILTLDENDRPALDALARLYQARGAHRDLALIYQRKIELASTDQEKRPLRFAMAKVSEHQLGDAFEAITAYRAVLDGDAGDVEALQALERLYEKEGQWRDLLDALDRQASLVPAAKRGQAEHNLLRYRAARVQEEKEGETASAIDRYRRLLDDAPDHEGVRKALEALVRSEESRDAAAAVLDPLYRMREEYLPLVELLELKLTAESDPSSRRALLAEIAEMHEIGLEDAGAAFSAWGRLIAESADDETGYVELERIAAQQSSWGELAGLYEQRLDAVFDPEVQRLLALKLADLYERRLSDEKKAISRYRKALDLPGDEMVPLSALDRLLAGAGQFRELAKVVQQEAQAVNDPPAQAEFLFRLGELRRLELRDAEGALSAYRDALDREPRHLPTRASLEGMLGSDRHAPQVLDILEPLAETDGDHAKQVTLAEARLRLTVGKPERSGLLQRIAELCDEELDDPVRALDALSRALAETPNDGPLAEEVERMGAEAHRPGDAAAAFERVLKAGVHAETAKEIGLRAARIYDKLGDDPRAEVRYLAVLEIDAESGDALLALERIYRQANASARLCEVLGRRAAVEMDLEGKKQLLAEVAKLSGGPLGDPAGAVAAWQKVLDGDEGDHDALDALASLHEQASRWNDLVAVLEQKARFTDSTADQIAMKELCASLHTEKTGDLDRAVDAYRDLLDLAPESLSALNALEDLQAKRGDWLALQEVLVRHLGVVKAGKQQVPILRRLAQLAIEKQKSPEDALAYYQQIVEVDPKDGEARAELEAVLEQTEKWWDLVEALKQHAAQAGTAGDKSREVALLVRAADVLESKLDSAGSATELLETILARDPRNVRALTSLAKIYEAAHDLDRCKQTLERAVALSPGGADAAELFYRMGRLEEERLGAAEGEAAAERCYQSAFEADVGHAGAVEMLERAARRRNEWQRVADLVELRSERLADADKRPLLLELAKIHSEKLGSPIGALPFLERAADLAPEDVTVIEPLADLYFATERYVDALPLYRKLIDTIGKGRRSKDVARFHYRMGAIAESGGNARRALENYQAAQQIDPSHAPTLAALGRLYAAESEWEKARRIYRSMLLQNLDPQAGMSKADVYFALGEIHEKVNEAQKAVGMYERGLELDPAHGRLREALARVKALR
ncbi:MAG: tetratricopeptide repeat protein [Myxococcales bacterium]|nr:tetratricopeptide repeat protein [Myxococcales bacterium]